MNFKNIIYTLLLIVGVLILLGIAVIRPENMLFYSILGVVILMGSGTMIMKEKKKSEE